MSFLKKKKKEYIEQKQAIVWSTPLSTMLKSQAHDNGNLTITVKWSLNGNFILPSLFVITPKGDATLSYLWDFSTSKLWTLVLIDT